MYFPVTSVDNFLKHPEYVYRLASSIEYKCNDGTFPGARSEPLHIIDNNLFTSICTKIFALFYNFQVCKNINWNVSMCFQKIEPFDGQENFYPHGWVHSDHDAIAAGLIYLSKETNLNMGTSIFNGVKPAALAINSDIKKQFYLNGTVGADEYNRAVEENNAQFEETITVKDRFNRLIMYDGSQLHGAKNIMRLEQPRYTLVFFVNSINTSHFPIPQSNLPGA